MIITFPINGMCQYWRLDDGGLATVEMPGGLQLRQEERIPFQELSTGLPENSN